jgi:hypothetical protein
MRIEWRSLVMTAALSLLGVGAWAQSATSTLQGTVADSGGQVVPGVTVTVESASTGLARTAVTTSAGVYVFNFIPPGTYAVTAGLAGFKTVRQENVKLNVGEARTLDFRTDNVVAQVQHILSPRVVNQVKFGMNRARLNRVRTAGRAGSAGAPPGCSCPNAPNRTFEKDRFIAFDMFTRGSSQKRRPARRR